MWRSVVAVCLMVLAGVVTVTGVSSATSAEAVVVAQTTAADPGSPSPEVNAPQQTDPGIGQETRKKLWIGGIALALFALVYWRNKKRWDKWRKAKKAG